jgi:Na+/H+ antiporter NhaC
METEQIARWAYVLFVVIAIIAGLAIGYMAYGEPPTTQDDPWYQNVAESNGYVILIMLILGVIIGLTSITAKEVTPFLIATIALVVSYAADVWQGFRSVEMLELLYYWATAILTYIVAFSAPAAVIIAIKSVFAMAKEA